MVWGAASDNNFAVFCFRDLTDDLNRHIGLILHIGGQKLRSPAFLALAVHQIPVYENDVVGAISRNLTGIPSPVGFVDLSPERNLSILVFFGQPARWG